MKNQHLQYVGSQLAGLILYKRDRYRYRFLTFHRQHLKFDILKCHCNSSGSQLYIYDGPGTDILIEHIRACDNVPMIGITTQYFVSLIEYDSEFGVGNHHMEIYVKEHFDEVIELYVPANKTSVRHNYTRNAILKKGFRIVTDPNANHYPRIKIKIEELHGYTDGICTFGGVLLYTDVTYFENIRYKNVGLICDMDESGYFVGKHDSLTLSHEPTFLLFFAFSNKFSLQLSFEITRDNCEGIFNICRLCYWLLSEGVLTYKLTYREATIYCSMERNPFNDQLDLCARVSFQANSCLKFQSMVLSDTLFCSYLTKYPFTAGHLTVGISFVAAKPLLSARKSCGIPYLNSRVTHMSQHPGNRNFTTKDEDIKFEANNLMLTHNRTCIHASFSYRLTLQTSQSSLVCVASTNLNLKLYSICGHLITNYHLPVLNRIFIR